MKLLLLVSALVLAATPACKQKEGEVCQIDSDCESGLVCNAATGRCQGRGGGVVDGGPDAPPGEADAAVDAPQDAGVDAS
jgi:hypothetical protein